MGLTVKASIPSELPDSDILITPLPDSEDEDLLDESESDSGFDATPIIFKLDDDVCGDQCAVGPGVRDTADRFAGGRRGVVCAGRLAASGTGRGGR